MRYNTERPRTLRTAISTIANHGFELGFGDCEPVRCQSTWSAGGRWALCSPDVVDRVVANFSLNSSGASEVWKLGECRPMYRN
jgi:hypothetical protein